MDTDKIEVLVEKISQAIKVIENLKSENSGYVEKISEYEKKINLLEKENKKLKELIEDQKSEIEKTDNLHKKLEDKIQMILKYLPEEEKIKKIKKEIKKDELKFNGKNDSDDARLSALIQNPESIEKKSLFNDNENKNDASFKKDVTSFKSNGDDKVKNSASENEKEESRVNIKFEETLLPKDEDKDIDFYFDDGESKKDELPKGVL